MKTFETDAYTMIVNTNLLIEFKVKSGVKLKASDIWESRDQSCGYIPGKKFFVLFEVSEGAEVTAEGRTAGASEEYSKHVSALALCSNKMHERILGNLFLKIHKPKVPTRFFENRLEGIVWLKSKME